MIETHLIPSSSNGHHGTHNSSNGVSANGTNLFPTSVKKKKKIADSKKVPDHVLSISSLAHCPSSCRSTNDSTSVTMQNSIDHQDPPLKRKRGRPPKNSKHTTIQPQRSSLFLSPAHSEQHESESIDCNEDQKGSVSSKSKRNHHQSRRGGLRADNPVPSLIRRGSSSSRSTSTVPSLHHLISRFEDQYNEMGKRYAEMGELLTQMKTAMEENRERSEQEIRRELLDEIQSNILQSMPKR